MKLSVLLLSVLLAFSCATKNRDKVFKIFNEGVLLSLKSIDEQNKGAFLKADSLNKQSIGKFNEVLALDSTHPLVRSVLAHGLYIDKQFKEAIHLFEEANKKNGESAANYRESGLCKINLGQMQGGKHDIDKAFAIDTTREIRELTIQDLTDIGELAFRCGEEYALKGEPDKGKGYKEFSIGVLALAFEYDKSKKDIALKVSEFADRIGDKEAAAEYKRLGDR